MNRTDHPAVRLRRGTVPRIGDRSAFPASRSLKSRPAHRGCPKKVLEPVPLAPFDIRPGGNGPHRALDTMLPIVRAFQPAHVGLRQWPPWYHLVQAPPPLRATGFAEFADSSRWRANLPFVPAVTPVFTVGSTGRSDIPSGAFQEASWTCDGFANALPPVLATLPASAATGDFANSRGRSRDSDGNDASMGLSQSSTRPAANSRS